MADESGGAAPRRGFRYQDKVAAYFFLKGLPEIHPENRPLEVHIEQDNADFYFIIRTDEREVGHYFEIKQTESGELKWGDYKSSVLAEFIEIEKEDTRPTDVEYFHTVVNTTFASRVNTVLSDAEDFRYGERSWIGLNRKREREYLDRARNDLEFEEDETLRNVIWGVIGHEIREENIDDKILDFLERCSPRNPKKNRRIILEEIREKGSGVLKRNEIEDELEIRLEPTNDQTSKSRNIKDIETDLQETTSQLDSESKKDLYHSTENLVRDYKRGTETENSRIESEATNALTKAQELQDLADKKEEKEFGLKRAINNMMEAKDSTNARGKND